MTDRIKQLEQFIHEDPGDPFNYYALGLAYVKMNEQKALEIFKQLRMDHEDYLPTYYQLAKLYERLGQKENASHTFSEGIIIANQQNDLKTLRELHSGREELEDTDV